MNTRLLNTGTDEYMRLYILWRTDPLLLNDRETNNETTIVVTQRSARNNGSTFGGGIFYIVRFEAISHHRPISVQFSSVPTTVQVNKLPL
jgi:hypothetical protein